MKYNVPKDFDIDPTLDDILYFYQKTRLALRSSLGKKSPGYKKSKAQLELMLEFGMKHNGRPRKPLNPRIKQVL